MQTARTGRETLIDAVVLLVDMAELRRVRASPSPPRNTNSGWKGVDSLTAEQLWLFWSGSLSGDHDPQLEHLLSSADLKPSEMSRAAYESVT